MPLRIRSKTRSVSILNKVSWRYQDVINCGLTALSPSDRFELRHPGLIKPIHQTGYPSDGISIMNVWSKRTLEPE